MPRAPVQVLLVLFLAVVAAVSVFLSCQRAPVETSLTVYDQYEDDVSDTAAGDSDDDGDPERARRELGAKALPLTDSFGDPVPIGKAFDSLVVGSSSGSPPHKLSATELDSPERAHFLHRHHLKVHLFKIKQSFAHVNMTVLDGHHPTRAQARAAAKWRSLVKRDARRTARLVQRIWHDARKVNALPEHVINRLKSMGLQHERMASSDDNSLLI